jgi:integrase
MASIFKRRKVKNEPYTIQYLDHLGKRRTAQGFTDKGLTEQLAAKLETEARMRKTGLIDVELEKVAEKRTSNIEEHLKAFEENISDNDPKYVSGVMNRLRRIVEHANFKTLGEIDPELIQSTLRAFRKEPRFGHRTYNHYLQTISGFCNWCVDTGRLLKNPLRQMESLNAEVDVRHARRALTADEITKLVDSARTSKVCIQKYDGETRARIYLMAYFTGLRRNELGSLTRGSFKLDETPPTVTVEAVSSKHRRKDILALHPDLVTMLREWLKGLKPREHVFPKLGIRKTWTMVKKDLERVGIPYETEEGIADFHAAGRHTHITELLRNGVTLPEAKELARHSDIKTTLRYTHIGMKDQARAIASLPTPKKAPKEPSEPATSKENDDLNALQMRCISGGFGGQLEALDVTGDLSDIQQNPGENQGFVVVRRPLSSGVVVGVTRHQLNFFGRHSKIPNFLIHNSTALSVPVPSLLCIQL